MIIALDVLGSINGTIYLSGIPNYNPITKKFILDQMEYVLNTKSIFNEIGQLVITWNYFKKAYKPIVAIRLKET